jgi:hypothetical protein
MAVRRLCVRQIFIYEIVREAGFFEALAFLFENGFIESGSARTNRRRLVKNKTGSDKIVGFLLFNARYRARA